MTNFGIMVQKGVMGNSMETDPSPLGQDRQFELYCSTDLFCSMPNWTQQPGPSSNRHIGHHHGHSNPVESTKPSSITTKQINTSNTIGPYTLIHSRGNHQMQLANSTLERSNPKLWDFYRRSFPWRVVIHIPTPADLTLCITSSEEHYPIELQLQYFSNLKNYVWAHAFLTFPNLLQTVLCDQLPNPDLQALQQCPQGISNSEGCTGCLRLSYIVQSAYLSSLADTNYWPKEHPTD